MSLTIPFSRQQRITNTLLLNASFIDNLGLMHGKMGIAIYFFHLARETKNSIYEDYAGELIDEIYDEISIHTPCNFENGLAGIGWGIEYLVRKGFIDADTDEVLEEIDNRIIHEINYHAPDEINILQGIGGYIIYFFNRINIYCSEDKTDKTIIKTFLDTVVLLMQRIEKYCSEFDFIDFGKEPTSFDLTWNFPSILWLLSELIDKKIYLVDAERLFNKLLILIADANIYPQLHSNRLLLAMMIEKVKNCKPEALSIDLSYKLSQKLINSIEYDQIYKEVGPNSAFLQNGTLGISFIYNQLFAYSNKLCFKDKSVYWKSHSFELTESDEGYAGFYVGKANENKAFGLLVGLAGIGLYELLN